MLTALVLMLTIALAGLAQAPSPPDNKTLRGKEDSLRALSEQVIDGSFLAERIYADSLFTRVLVRALKEEGSFFFPFDSLYTVSRLYSPDSSFRIITWQVQIHPNRYRQRGAIQMHTKDGSLKLFPLIDKSDVIISYEDTITDHTAWPGAVYYNIIRKEVKGKPVYTLLGYDENDMSSNKKLIEILDLSGEKPVFGRFMFSGRKCARYIIEYKKAAGPRMNYDSELDMIIFEHLISESGEPLNKYTLVGDGDYEAFRWNPDFGQWLYVPKLFEYVTPENKEPVPMPMLENKLDFDEEMKKQPEKASGKKEKKNR